MGMFDYRGQKMQIGLDIDWEDGTLGEVGADLDLNLVRTLGQLVKTGIGTA